MVKILNNQYKDFKDLDLDNEIKTGGMGSILLKDGKMPF